MVGATVRVAVRLDTGSTTTIGQTQSGRSPKKNPSSRPRKDSSTTLPVGLVKGVAAPSHSISYCRMGDSAGGAGRKNQPIVAEIKIPDDI